MSKQCRKSHKPNDETVAAMRECDLAQIIVLKYDVERLTAENADLQHDINRHLDICTSLTAENERLRAALQEIVGMFRETKFGTTELDLPNYEVLEVARRALNQQTTVNSEEGK